MQQQRENNPHFLTPPLSPPASPPLSPPRPHRGRRPKKPSSDTGPVIKQPPSGASLSAPFVIPHPRPHPPPGDQHRYPPPPDALHHPGPKHPSEVGQPRPHPGTLHHGDHFQPQEPQLHPAGIRPQHPQQHPGRHRPGQHGHHQQRPSSIRLPGSRKTTPLAWLIAAFCTLFWVIVIVGGLAILIIYLIFRPHLPKFDISSATLNAAYLDMGYLLNADLTILGNFTNPNKKVNVDFSYVVMDLYHDRAPLATRYVEPFTALRRQSRFEDVHMITSQVPLSSRHSQELKRQMDNGKVMFEIKGYFRARSNLGGFLRYSYWLYSHCTITVTGPPTGIMIAKKCTTKR